MRARSVAPMSGDRVGTPVRRWPERRAVVLGGAAIFAVVVFLVGQLDQAPDEGIGFLYALPVMLTALELGLDWGLAAAGAAFGLIVIWGLTTDQSLTATEFALRAVALLVIGGVAGRYSDRMRAARRRQDQLLHSGLALAHLTDRAVLPETIAMQALQALPAAGARFQIDGADPVEVGELGPGSITASLPLPGGESAVLEVAPESGRSFSADDRIALEMLALQAAVAAENQRLVASERERAMLRDELVRSRERLAKQGRQLEHLLAGQEDERRALAQDLHEDAAQALASIQLGLRVVETDVGSEQQRHHVETLRSHLAETLVALRELAVDLRPPVLDELGLVPALQGLAARVPAADQPVTIEVKGDDERLEADLETTVYRVVAESIGAIEGPVAARVAIDRRKGEVRITMAQPRGEGHPISVDVLARIRARVDLAGGLLTVSSEERHMLVAHIPMAQLTPSS
jgi:signal transduction histidine kinase